MSLPSVQNWTGTAGYWFVGYWDIELGLQGIGLQIWDCRVLDWKAGNSECWITGQELRGMDHKFGISGYWITNLGL